MKTKKEWRQYIRELKDNYSALQKTEMSNRILARLEADSHFVHAHTLLLYHALPDEVQTSHFINKWYQKKRIILPKVAGDNLSLHLYTGPECLGNGAFGILEPQNKPFLEPETIDLAIVPGMAFDQHGNRLGRGKGFYDRLLQNFANSPIYIIGIAFPFQIVEQLPTETTDIPMNQVIF